MPGCRAACAAAISAVRMRLTEFWPVILESRCKSFMVIVSVGLSPLQSGSAHGAQFHADRCIGIDELFRWIASARPIVRIALSVASVLGVPTAQKNRAVAPNRFRPLDCPNVRRADRSRA